MITPRQPPRVGGRRPCCTYELSTNEGPDCRLQSSFSGPGPLQTQLCRSWVGRTFAPGPPPQLRALVPPSVSCPLCAPVITDPGHCDGKRNTPTVCAEPGEVQEGGLSCQQRDPEPDAGRRGAGGLCSATVAVGETGFAVQPRERRPEWK